MRHEIKDVKYKIYKSCPRSRPPDGQVCPLGQGPALAGDHWVPGSRVWDPILVPRGGWQVRPRDNRQWQQQPRVLSLRHPSNVCLCLRLIIGHYCNFLSNGRNDECTCTKRVESLCIASKVLCCVAFQLISIKWNLCWKTSFQINSRK